MKQFGPQKTASGRNKGHLCKDQTQKRRYHRYVSDEHDPITQRPSSTTGHNQNPNESFLRNGFVNYSGYIYSIRIIAEPMLDSHIRWWTR